MPEDKEQEVQHTSDGANESNELPENKAKEGGTSDKELTEPSEGSATSEPTVATETTTLPENAENSNDVDSSEAATVTNDSQETPSADTAKDQEVTVENPTETTSDSVVSQEVETEVKKEAAPEPDATRSAETNDAEISETAIAPTEKKKPEEEEAVLAEIDEENAEDAEDSENQQRHQIPILDYHSMSMENLVGELQRLVRNEKVQAIKKHVDGIKYEFDQKFQEFIDGKKQDFVANGGNEIDFHYNSVTKRQFNEVFSDYREKRNQYYKNLENTLKENLSKRLEIIEELKGLVNVEEDINTTYANFKSIQERWRNAGPVPRTQYNDVWRTYRHHMEIFYDFLHLNRELRDLDFKHNLEEKTKLVEKAEALATEENLGKAFRELQMLHKVWKEDIGPVDRDHRDAIWDRFSNATKVLHQRRQEYHKVLEASYGDNLILKNELISKIQEIGSNAATNHRGLQQQIKEVAQLREQFFAAGKVPQHANEATWAAFKDAVRTFNHNKNTFYKSLKKEQQQNLDKKRALLGVANELKDSDEWDTATQEMKRIQNEWKQIGHVPRKYSDSIWKDFKNACNHYFDRLHARKNSAHQQEEENLKKKLAFLENLRAFELGGEKEKDLERIKGFVSEWKGLGRVPYKQKNIDQKFQKILDALFRKIGLSKQEAELLQYGNKINQLSTSEDQERALGNERQFVRKKITESKNEIRQLENNLQFFSNASEDNPLVKDVIKNIDRHKKALETWQGKLKKLNIMVHQLHKTEEEGTNEADIAPEDTNEEA